MAGPTTSPQALNTSAVSFARNLSMKPQMAQATSGFGCCREARGLNLGLRGVFARIEAARALGL